MHSYNRVIFKKKGQEKISEGEKSTQDSMVEVINILSEEIVNKNDSYWQ